MQAQHHYAVEYAPAPVELPGPPPPPGTHYTYSYATGGYPVEVPAQEYDNTYSWYSGYTAPSAKNPRPQRPAHFYVPPILRLPALLIVFLITLALIGAVEYGIQKLPHAQKTLHRDPREVIQSIIHQKRQASATTTRITVSTSSTSTTSPQATGTTIPGAYVPTAISTSTSSTPPVLGTTATSAYVPTALPTATSSGGYVPTQITTAGLTSTSAYVPTAIPTGTVPPDSYVPTQSSAVYVPQTFTTSISIPTTIVTSYASSFVTTNAAGQRVTSTTYVPTTTTGLATVSTMIVGAGKTTRPLFPMWTIFVGNYLPLFIIVIFRQLWIAIYAQVKLIEPFMILANGKSVAAGAVLNSFYLSSNLTPDPFLAFARRHYFVLWSSMIYIVVGFLGPFSSEILFLDTKYPGCPFVAANDAVNPCWPPRLSIDPVLARIVEGLLSYIAVMTLTIMAMIWRSKSGIYSDPSSIASITSLVHHPEVVHDFRTIGEEASTKDIMAVLAHKSYKLGEYQRPDGVWRYGIVPAAPSFDGYMHEKPAPPQIKPKNRRWKVWDFIADAVFILCLLGLAGVIAYYYKDSKNDGFNRFFNSRSFGPRFILTGAGTIIALNWKRLERDAHTLSPYHRMSQAPSDARNTILLRKSSIPLTSIFPMLFKGHVFVACMAFVAVLSDILILFLGAVPFAAGQVLTEIKVATFTCLGIIGIMVIGIICLIVWKRRLPDLPRAPDTIAAVVSYVADSRMLDDFEGFEYMDDREMTSRLAGTGKRYVYGKRPGSDGQSRYLVDQDTQLLY